MSIPEEERERVIALLREHAGEGRLDLDEFGQRLDEAYQATSLDQLQHALRELPARRTESATAPSSGQSRRTSSPPRSQTPGVGGPWPGPQMPMPMRMPHSPHVPSHVKAKMARAAWQTHVTTYMAVNLFLIMIWLSTSGAHSFFWPMFPIGGWGIGVAAHGAAYMSGRPRSDR